MQTIDRSHHHQNHQSVLYLDRFAAAANIVEREDEVDRVLAFVPVANVVLQEVEHEVVVDVILLPELKHLPENRIVDAANGKPVVVPFESYQVVHSYQRRENYQHQAHT